MSTHFLSVSTCLHFCINLLSLIIKSYVDTSSKWVDLLGILHLTVSTHTTCVSVYFQRILKTVSTHDKYVSTYLWVICLVCRHCLHMCRPVYEFSAQRVDTACIRVDLSVKFSASWSLSIKPVKQSSHINIYNISLELSKLIIFHHQNQRSNNLPLFDDGNYESWYFKEIFIVPLNFKTFILTNH